MEKNIFRGRSLQNRISDLLVLISAAYSANSKMENKNRNIKSLLGLFRPFVRKGTGSSIKMLEWTWNGSKNMQLRKTRTV